MPADQPAASAGRHRDAHPAVPAGRPARLGADRPPALAARSSTSRTSSSGRHDEAEDLTQDIFLKIFKSLDTFDRRANFQTWLISVSRNLCIDHYRSVRKERETIDRGVDAERAVAAPRRAGPDGRARAARPGGAAAAGARRAAGDAADRRACMRDIQELSYQEIADRLRLPEGTVKSRINRGPHRAGPADPQAAAATTTQRAGRPTGARSRTGAY